MKACKWCKEQIHKSARKCPRCGGRLSTHPLTGCFAILLLIAMATCVRLAVM